MKLSTRARYALRMMVEIAKESKRGDAARSLKDISEKTNISRRYLEQLAIALKNASLVSGIAGKGGGYMLTRRPEEITIDEIIEAAIGPINIVDCVLMPETCLQADLCECRAVYQHINQKIADALKGISLAGLAKGGFAGNDAFIGKSEIAGCPARRPPSPKSS
jgi:Rrf2 family protein